MILLEALQSYNINPWHDGMIDAGGNIDDNVKIAINKADIILLLVTDSFMASHYCMKIELDNAMKRDGKMAFSFRIPSIQEIDCVDESRNNKIKDTR